MLSFEFPICDFTSTSFPPPTLLPTRAQYLPLFPSPLYIHHSLDYANMGSFMSSVLRIFFAHGYVKKPAIVTSQLNSILPDQ